MTTADLGLPGAVPPGLHRPHLVTFDERREPETLDVVAFVRNDVDVREECPIATQAAAAHTNPDQCDMLNCALVMMKNNTNSTICP